MNNKIIWQQKSEYDNNPTNLALISDWWSSLAQKKVKIAQRLIPETGNVNDINWESQRFDEEFILEFPQIRGITVYGKKAHEEKEFGYTPQKLELDIDNQELDIYLQSQAHTIIRLSVATITYQTFSLGEVEIVSNGDSKNNLMLVRNTEKKVEVTFNLNSNQQLYLLNQLAKTLNLKVESEN